MATATTLAEIIADVAAQDGERTAIIFGEQRLSYAQTNGMIEQVADALAARGIAHGDRVGLMVPNIPQFVVAYYAILRLGAVVVPLNLLYKAEEVGYILDDSEAKALIVFEMFYPQIAAALPTAKSLQHTIFIGQNAAPEGTTHWAALLAPGTPQRERATVAPTGLAVICYTSGTTGRPKGAMLTHRNFIANCEQMSELERFRAGPDDITLLVLPLFHIYGMNVGMNAGLRAGGTLALIPRFEPIPVLEAIQALRATIFLGAPPMYIAWVNTPGLENYDLSSLRVVNSGAAPLPREVLSRFKEATGIEIQEGYGLTETAPVSHTNSAAPEIRPGTIGWALPGVDARVVDETDQDVPDGQEGELILRGENVMVGYWRREEDSAEALRGGWFHTGDIVTRDADGYYTVVDRKKDMINAGGFKVWPREVEEVLFAHPAVREAAVVAVPDPYAGERPLAYVALKTGQSATAEDLIAYCKSRLASFKAPTRVEFRDELPKLPTGKVLRRVLRDEARSLTPAGDN
jgi:long-chain acyl-CoA synthetase